jgi:hypothetical protein
MQNSPPYASESIDDKKAAIRHKEMREEHEIDL